SRRRKRPRQHAVGFRHPRFVFPTYSSIFWPTQASSSSPKARTSSLLLVTLTLNRERSVKVKTGRPYLDMRSLRWLGGFPHSERRLTAPAVVLIRLALDGRATRCARKRFLSVLRPQAAPHSSAMTLSCSQPAWQRTSSLPSTSRSERL